MEVLYYRHAKRVGMGRLTSLIVFLVLLCPTGLVTLFYTFGVRYGEAPELWMIPVVTSGKPCIDRSRYCPQYYFRFNGMQAGLLRRIDGTLVEVLHDRSYFHYRIHLELYLVDIGRRSYDISGAFQTTEGRTGILRRLVDLDIPVAAAPCIVELDAVEKRLQHLFVQFLTHLKHSSSEEVLLKSMVLECTWGDYLATHLDLLDYGCELHGHALQDLRFYFHPTVCKRGTPPASSPGEIFCVW